MPDAGCRMSNARAVTVEAHKAGMGWTGETPVLQADVRAAMGDIITAHNMTCAYPSIVTVHG
jgi:Xaa-Pro aminopeptidase